MRSALRTVVAALGLGSAALVPAAAHATTMHAFSASELTYVADLVAEAEVEAAQPERDDASAFIKTVATLRLTRVVKGDALEGDRVLVREWGGTIGSETTELPGAPVYVPGERVLVYLEQENRPEPLWRTVGLGQGKLTLVEEPDTGRDVALKLRADRALARFVESDVFLPAVRAYADTIVAQATAEVDAGFVPTYLRIPGLPAWKDERFLREAEAAGQAVDARWTETRRAIVEAEAARLGKEAP